MKRAAEEIMNDTELVKGIGPVPINRSHPVETHFEKKFESYTLSPRSYAYKDLKFQMRMFLSAKTHIVEDVTETGK